MTGVPLRVASVPTDAMTETNLVYVNPQDNPQHKIAHVRINGYPFTLKNDSQVPPGTIAMNSIQRRCAHVSTMGADAVDIHTCSYKHDRSMVMTMQLEIEYIASSKKGGQLDATEFTKWFLHQFHDQCFTVGQTIAAIGIGKYIVNVAKMDARSMTNDEAPVGQMHMETKLVLSTKEKCEIQLVNLSDDQIDNQQQHIVGKFDLENLGIGGLKAEFGQVFRRAFASRIFPQSLVKKLGITHVKGVLLHGPPGTGKTLIARKIGEILNCREPKIVNGPEVFNKYVGGTEENVRKLFAEAEEEWNQRGEQSQLHLIIFDEFDAICKQRGAVRDNTGVSDNVVNQLLSKIDGVNSLNNVLLIGMTNRKDLIDEAILRSGRFEVHVEIGLCDKNGREEIFRIHTRGMRENSIMHEDVELIELAEKTKNFSGAEIAGVVRSATSHAFNRHIDFENPSETVDPSSVKIQMQDFDNALKEVKPAFGQATDECQSAMRNGIIEYGPKWSQFNNQIEQMVQHLRDGTRLQLLSVLIDGAVGAGKSAVAAHMAMESAFPYVKLISPDTLVGYGEAQKANIVRKAFEDAYKSQLSVIILDDIERLIEYSHLSARYSNILLQAILVLVKRPPPEGKKVLVIGTTSLSEILDQLEITGNFNVHLHVPSCDPLALAPIAQGLGARFKTPDDEQQCIQAMPTHVPIKKLILMIEMALEKHGDDDKSRLITYDSFTAALLSAGFASFA